MGGVGSELRTWWGLKTSGLVDPGDLGPGAQDLRYEGRSLVEVVELTSPMFFISPSLTIAWALWVLEGLCPLALKGFSKEQLYFSPPILEFMASSLQVTWSLCVPSGMLALIGLPLGTGVGRRLDPDAEKD